MKNILIAVSMEDELLAPLKKIKDKINFNNCNVTLVHIVQKEIFSVDLATYEWPNPNEFKQIREHAIKKMEHMKPHILGDQTAKSFNVDVILDLSAKEALIEMSKKISADLIIVATRGKKGFPGLFSSSMSDYLMKYSPCDVLVLRPLA